MAAATFALAPLTGHAADENGGSSKWYIETALGQVTSHWSRSDFNEQLQPLVISGGISNFDDERFAWSLLAGYEFNDWLHLEAGWRDWGEVDLQLTALALDSNAIESLIAEEYPRSGAGVYAGAKSSTP